MKNFDGSLMGAAWAQDGAAAIPGMPKGGAFGMFLPMILIFAVFYLLLIRPQAKQRKQHATLISQLKKGDEVVTTSGIHGKVAGVAENVVTLEVADNVRLKFDKQHVASVKSTAASS